MRLCAGGGLTDSAPRVYFVCMPSPRPARRYLDRAARSAGLHRVNVCLPGSVLDEMDAVIERYGRSQWLSYAARAMCARLDGRVADAARWEAAARGLVRAEALPHRAPRDGRRKERE